MPVIINILYELIKMLHKKVLNAIYATLQCFNLGLIRHKYSETDI